MDVYARTLVGRRTRGSGNRNQRTVLDSDDVSALFCVHIERVSAGLNVLRGHVRVAALNRDYLFHLCKRLSALQDFFGELIALASLDAACHLKGNACHGKALLGEGVLLDVAFERPQCLSYFEIYAD